MYGTRYEEKKIRIIPLRKHYARPSFENTNRSYDANSTDQLNKLL